MTPFHGGKTLDRVVLCHFDHLFEEPACRLVGMSKICVLAQFLVARLAWEF